MARVLGSYPIGRWFESYCRYHIRPVGQEVKTSPFHGGIMGSIPVRVTINTTLKWLCKAVWEFFLLCENSLWVLFGSCFLSRPSFAEIESLRNSVASLNLILSEHMPVDIQTCAYLRVSENARNCCRVNSCPYQ